METENKLTNSKSPYLREHSKDPVNWNEWSNPIFEKAKKDNKLIFISIGYSTCHWCHVMQKESFNDLEVAKILNESFISIKVDKEERPDINNYYMTLCQKINGNGGWPLTILLLPDLSQILVSTYIPKNSNLQTIGLLDYLKETSETWIKHPEKLRDDASILAERLTNNKIKKEKKDISENILNKMYKNISNIYDYDYGGFGTGMKFPMPGYLGFLLRYYNHTGIADALNMVKHTLVYIRFSCMYDQIGFGLHRYSTTRDWSMPHFEKMLYDQALMGTIYLETYQLTHEVFFLNISEEIAFFMADKLLSNNGAFYTAIDADTDHVEGKYYTLMYEQLTKTLDDEELKIFSDAFGIEKNGNYSIGHDPLSNGNIPYQNMSQKELAEKYNMPITDVVNIIDNSIKKVRRMRDMDSKLKIDNKILADVNGLSISFMSKLYGLTLNKKYLAIATIAADFVINNMLNKDTLFHSYVDNSYINGYLDDYAFVISAFIDLYESSFIEKYLEYAIKLSKIMIQKFYDAEKHIFFLNEGNDPYVNRQEILYDNVEPSGNSIAILDLMRISRIMGNNKYNDIAMKSLESILTYENNILNYNFLLYSIFYMFGNSYEFVIAPGDDKNLDIIKQVTKQLSNKFIPNKIVLLTSSYVSKIADYTRNMAAVNNSISLYICKNYTCELPIIGIKNIKESINNIN